MYEYVSNNFQQTVAETKATVVSLWLVQVVGLLAEAVTAADALDLQLVVISMIMAKTNEWARKKRSG